VRRLAVVSILALLAGVSSAQEKAPDAHPLPLNPAANAKEGDWATFSLTLKVTTPGKTSDAPPVERTEPTAYSVWTFEKISGDAATLRDTDLGNKKKTHVRSFSTKDPVTLEAFLAKDAGDLDQVSQVTSDEEKHTVGGKEFACKKVTCTTSDGKLTIHWTLWFCSTVKGSGLVHMSGEVAGPKQKVTMSLELAGFGSREKAEWGKTADELAKELKAPEPKRETSPPADDAPKPDPKKP
jgi:hypothetical protein